MGIFTMRDVFEECQHGRQSHGKLATSLYKIYQSNPLDTFWNEFLHHLKYSLIIFKRETAVEETIDFVAKFAASLCEKDNEKARANENSESDVEQELNPFVHRLFDFLLSNHNVCDKAVRYRCCQLINKLLSKMGDEAQINEDLFDRIFECMLQRLRDKVPIVRVHAVFALSRLQDPSDTDDPVINAYVFLLNCDVNSDVRRAVLNCIAASTKTLPAIIERTRDTKDLVRKLSYQILATKVHIKALTIAQRVQLLKDGLNDRADMVRDACVKKLLQAWLRTTEGSIVDLLQCLDVENCLVLAEKTVAQLIKKVPAKELMEGMDMLNDQQVLPVEDLTCESVLYWKCVAVHLRSCGIEGDELLEKIVPNSLGMANYLKGVFGSMQIEEDVDQELRNEFVLQQLLGIACLLDHSDEAGRKSISQLVKNLLISEKIGHRLVKSLLHLYVKVHMDPESRINELVEIISEIREPTIIIDTPRSKEQQRQLDVKIAKIRVELNQLRESLDECIQQQEFSKAAEIKEKVTELEKVKADLVSESVPASQEVRQEKNDPATMLKCLTISAEMLQVTKLTTVIPSLRTLIDELILKGVVHEDPAVRNKAVKSLGLCCLISQDIAKSKLLLFVQVSQMDQAIVKMTALEVIFDLLHMFGLDAFNVDNAESVDDHDSDNESGLLEGSDDSDFEDNFSLSMISRKGKTKENTSELPKEPLNTASSLLSILIGLLESETSEVRTVAAEGLAKLLLSRRVVSHKLISRLLLLWFNPITEDDTHLRHCLGAFFPLFAFQNRENQELMEEAFLPTMRTLFNAPKSSPLAEINVNNVAELMVQLTNARFLVKDIAKQLELEQACHDDLAMKICNEILSAPNSFDARTLCRILTLLQLTPTNTSCLKDLRILASQMRQKVKDKQCFKSIEKFKEAVKDMLRSSISDNTVDQTQNTESVIEENMQEELQKEETDMQVDESGTDPEKESISESEKTTSTQAGNETQVDDVISELSDKTNQLDLEELSKSQSQSSVSPVATKPKTRKSKRTKTDAQIVDSEPEVVKKRSTRSEKQPASSKRVTQLKKQQPESSGSEMESDSVFVTPTPLKKGSRARKGKLVASKDPIKRTLQSDLASDSQEEEDISVPTRSRSTRSSARRK